MRLLIDKSEVRIVLCLASMVVFLLIASPAGAINRYWDAGGTTNSLGELANWDQEELGLPTTADDVNFDDTGLANLTPETGGVDYQYRYLKFPATCTVVAASPLYEPLS